MVSKDVYLKKIVKEYMARNPSITLNELMIDTDFNSIFTGAKYKP